jgi:hypothetical protein
MSSHDAAYTGMPITVQTIEEKFCADTILIFSRDGRLLYSNDLKAGDWRSPAKASETIKQEQQRALLKSEKQELIADWQRVFQLMNERHASLPELEQARKIQKSIIDFT